MGKEKWYVTDVHVMVQKADDDSGNFQDFWLDSYVNLYDTLPMALRWIAEDCGWPYDENVEKAVTEIEKGGINDLTGNNPCVHLGFFTWKKDLKESAIKYNGGDDNDRLFVSIEIGVELVETKDSSVNYIEYNLGVKKTDIGYQPVCNY